MREFHFDKAFQDVDRAEEPLLCMLYLDAISELDTVKAYKRHTHSILKPVPGDHVLDVGCGLGHDVHALSLLVGPSGAAMGVDRSRIMIEEAISRHSAANVEFHCASAESLPFDDFTFECCRADRTLQHLIEPDRAVREMYRVLKCGGRIVVAEPDYETLLIDAGDPGTTRRILSFYCDSLANGRMGRRLPSCLFEAGFRGVQVSAHSFVFQDSEVAERALGIKGAAARALKAIVITPEEAGGWLDDIANSATQGTMFCALTGIITCGIKPEAS